MNISSTYLNLIDRVVANFDRLPELTAAQLNTHPGGHANSAAWNLWHVGRVLDVLGVEALAAREQIWTEEDFRSSFDLGLIGDSTGFGQNTEQARTIIVEDHQLLVDYIFSVLQVLRAYIEGLEDEAFGDVVGEKNGKPETRQDRLLMIFIDTLQHMAQAQYVTGMPDVHS